MRLPNLFNKLSLVGVFVIVVTLFSCSTNEQEGVPNLERSTFTSTEKIVNRAAYSDKLYGFWLGTCIANWTGLVTEMDKIGNIGDIKTGDFYTRNDWGKPDQPSIWAEGEPSKISPIIDFVFIAEDSIWGADDDTDIEYIYQELLLRNKTAVLSGEQIREGWLKHIKVEEENYLWVSNQKAFDLMRKGMIPPATSEPKNNPEYEMIDAQLTTEIFGLFAPTRPDIALKMARLPIQTTARENSEWISKFYVTMFSLASVVDENLSQKEQVLWMADQAKHCLPEHSYAAKMYAYVLSMYDADIAWEQARDSIYIRYQVNQQDGYGITAQKRYCNGCFAAGINFAASLVSLFYGEGDIIETIKIGTLAGWDSDNPTATWGGLLGFMIGKEGVEKAFNRKFSNRYNIHRTRIGFPNNGIDSFENMAAKGLTIIDRVVAEEMSGRVNLAENLWHIPIPRNTIKYPIIAHAHNDYEQKYPITTALNHGFTSLEVDIVFDGTNLIVSHDGENLDTKGHFETAYLAPLLNRLDVNQAPLILLVDIKNYSDQMLAQLNSVLKKYENDLLKRSENTGSSKKIQIVLSGDIPRAAIISNKANEFLFIDGRIEDLAFDYSKQYMPMISMNFTDLTNWEGIKKPSKASLQAIQKTIDLAHQKGKKIRFWKTAETELLWRTLIDLNVDFIGVDGIENFYATFE